MGGGSFIKIRLSGFKSLLRCHSHSLNMKKLILKPLKLILYLPISLSLQIIIRPPTTINITPGKSFCIGNSPKYPS